MSSQFRLILALVANTILCSQSAAGADTIVVENDKDERYEMIVWTADRERTIYSVESGDAVPIFMGLDPHEIKFSSESGIHPKASVYLRTKGDRISLSDAITEVGETRDGRSIFQLMRQNGFYPSKDDNEFLQKLEKSSWQVTYHWDRRENNVNLKFNRNQGWSGDYRLSDVQYVASDSFYILGNWKGNYNGVFVLEIPRSSPNQFSGDGTGHEDWFSFSGRRLR